MASNLTVDTLTKGSTTLNTDEIVDTNSSQVCKAWVNFNGSGTVAIRDSFNVSSVTDNGTGIYTANFTTAFTNTNYMAVESNYIRSTGAYNDTIQHSYDDPRTTTSMKFRCRNNGTYYDFSYVELLFLSAN